MKNSDRLAAFVQDALTAGRSREDIHTALSQAGWTEHEIAAGLGIWSDTSFSPPVPRPQPFVSAREAFLYGLMFVALAMTAWHITALGMNLIDRWVPEPGRDDYYRYTASSIRWSISALIVFFPVFLLLNRRANTAIQSDPGQRRSLVRKWFGYITLFLATITLLGDLLLVIHALLDGDLTLRFLAKYALVALVAGVIFLYFRADMAEDQNAY